MGSADGACQPPQSGVGDSLRRDGGFRGDKSVWGKHRGSVCSLHRVGQPGVRRAEPRVGFGRCAA